ncbi:hypothetical protein [Saccharopolyspora mangrovi]|uniref:Uncharacterized protein n=1 Tax=Saccharopolyspora mangrovi TaxID=3082379 RepID=A0ABU6AIP2_9PSEU|nr:hypothetical protein [Saccharopolyspora sp. S2-29]MEB3371358.1 hypothetical protein [Saccharopolyspora sp. S2-29]
MKTAQKYEISAYDSEPNELANILTGWLKQNLESSPQRYKIARAIPRPVTVHSTDTKQTTSIVFYEDRALVFNDLVGRPSVVVKASVPQLAEVSQVYMKARGYLPVGFFTRRGRRILEQIMTRNLVIKGLLTHTATALNFVALISVAD